MNDLLITIAAVAGFAAGVGLYLWAIRRWPGRRLPAHRSLLWSGFVIGCITACTFMIDFNLHFLLRAHFRDAAVPMSVFRLKLQNAMWLGMIGGIIGALIGSRYRSRTYGAVNGSALGAFLSVALFNQRVPTPGLYIYTRIENVVVYAMVILLVGGSLGMILSQVARHFGKISVLVISLLPLLYVGYFCCSLVLEYVLGPPDRIDLYAMGVLVVFLYCLPCGLTYGLPFQHYLSSRRKNTPSSTQTAEPATPPS